MIGVVARAEEHGIVREFFELFKTPWEFCRENGRYEVVIHTSGAFDHDPAKLVIVYGSQATAFDQGRKTFPGPQRQNTTLSWNGDRIPVYGRCVTFQSDGRSPNLILEDTHGVTTISTAPTAREWTDESEKD